MNIGIIGGGMVGNAVANGFKNNNLLISDPELNNTTVKQVCDHSELIFVCVPTPTDNGDFNPTIINQVCSEINEFYTGDVIIKSTILPNYLKNIYNVNKNINLAYNPEFLSDRTADKDFVSPYMVVIGTEDQDYANRIEKIYRENSCVVCNNYHKVDLITASMIKYGFNTFFATKVIFMNELYGVFRSSGTSMSWEDFRNVISQHPWMGPEHIQVPGHDGYFGYGGKCFPKDTMAFSKYAHQIGKPTNLLDKTIELNEKYRNE